MSYKWNYQTITQEQEATTQTLSKRLNINPVLGRLLVLRGIETEEEARSFFHPQLSRLHDPFLMRDMDVAVQRLNRAMGRKERLLIYGDYVEDGTHEVTLVYKLI